MHVRGWQPKDGVTMTTKQQSLAEAFEAWCDGGVWQSHGSTWEDFDSLVARVRALEAENAHNAHWHDHYGTLSDKLEAERDAYAKLAANAQERLAGALEREHALEQTLRNGGKSWPWLEHEVAAARRKALEECEKITTRHYDSNGIWLEIKALIDDEPKT